FSLSPGYVWGTAAAYSNVGPLSRRPESAKGSAAPVRLSNEPAHNQAPCSHGPSLPQGGKVVNSRFVSHTLLTLFASSALLTPLAVHAATPALLIDKPGAY